MSIQTCVVDPQVLDKPPAILITKKFSKGPKAITIEEIVIFMINMTVKRIVGKQK